MSQKDRAETYGRDLERCARCGSGSDRTIQHRVGGRARTNRPSNLLTLCQPCHMWVEAHPLLADAAGWSCPSWEDPAAWPVVHKMWGLVLLTDDWSIDFNVAA